MNGSDNSTFITLLVISNLIALLFIWAAWKLPRLGQLLFFLLFAWAGWTNWSISINHPAAYIEYGDLAVFQFYREFIHGWFKEHVQLMVGVIATCQLLIALGMLAKGAIFKIAAVGAIMFFLAILPLGVGSGFPCTLLFAIAMYLLLRNTPSTYLWVKEKRVVLQ